jgi:hypothetical protein
MMFSFQSGQLGHSTNTIILKSNEHKSYAWVFGVIHTFQSSQFFEHLSMHFGVVDHIRASALSTADCRPPSWNRITDSTFVHIAYSSGSPEFTSDYSDYLGVCDFFVLYRLVVVGLFLCFPGLYFVLGCCFFITPLGQWQSRRKNLIAREHIFVRNSYLSPCGWIHR